MSHLFASILTGGIAQTPCSVSRRSFYSWYEIEEPRWVETTRVGHFTDELLYREAAVLESTHAASFLACVFASHRLITLVFEPKRYKADQQIPQNCAR